MLCVEMILNEVQKLLIKTAEEDTEEPLVKGPHGQQPLSAPERPTRADTRAWTGLSAFRRLQQKGTVAGSAASVSFRLLPQAATHVLNWVRSRFSAAVPRPVLQCGGD